MQEYIVSAQYFLMIELRQTCNYLFACTHAQKSRKSNCLNRSEVEGCWCKPSSGVKLHHVWDHLSLNKGKNPERNRNARRPSAVFHQHPCSLLSFPSHLPSSHLVSAFLLMTLKAPQSSQDPRLPQSLMRIRECVLPFKLKSCKCKSGDNRNYKRQEC